MHLRNKKTGLWRIAGWSFPRGVVTCSRGHLQWSVDAQDGSVGSPSAVLLCPHDRFPSLPKMFTARSSENQSGFPITGVIVLAMLVLAVVLNITAVIQVLD